MLIGIDGNEANIARRVGVNQYAFQILHGLYNQNAKLKNKHTFRIYLKEEPLKDLPKETKHWKYKVIEGGGMWIIRKLMPTLFTESDKPNIFFTPSHYIPPFSPQPKACAIMDLGYLEFSGQFRPYDYWQLRLWSAWSLFRSSLVLTISEASKKDIISKYKFAGKKLVVTMPGYDAKAYNTKMNTKKIEAVRRKYKTGKKYVLFMSTLKPSKNIEGLLRAWRRIEHNNSDAKLIIAGKKGWLFSEIFEEVKRLKLEKRVVFTGFVDKKDKEHLIKGARAFALPSFWEGFGIDVVTSMASGIPVIVSDRGSLPEVAGKAGIIVNPDNDAEIANAMQNVLQASEKRYNKWAKAGIRQAKLFSSQKSAEITLKALTNI